MKTKLINTLYSLSLLLFITAFGFQHNPPSGWYQQFMPTDIEFSIPVSSSVDLRVYNLLGREILSVYLNEFLPAGTYGSIIDFSNLSLSSGIYFYTLAALSNKGNSYRQTNKMIYNK